jgi:hypothetical protein
VRTTSRVQAVNPGAGNKGGNKNVGKLKKNP